MPLGGSVAGYRSAAAYSGPGDAVSGAQGFWGARSYTLAAVGGTVIRLRRDSDNAEQDFVTITGGGLDVASITTFKGAANLFTVTLYDQVGTNHATQATAATQPPFTVSSPFNSLPALGDFGSTTWVTTGSVTNGHPVTVLGAVRIGTGAAGTSAWVNVASGGFELRVNGSKQETLCANNANLVIGTQTISNNTSFVACASYDGNNAAQYYNGASDNTGTNAIGITARTMGIGGNSAENWNGYIGEVISYGSILNSTQVASLSSNARTFWGF